MNALVPLHAYLGSIDNLIHQATTDGGRTYVEPALKNLGSIAIPIVREVIAEAVFRGEDPEITDITVGGKRHVRATANKFKFGERQRGLQLLRYFGAGGAMAQNRTEFQRGDKPSKGYDANTLVFGDSADLDKAILPVTAGVQYSDAISLAPYAVCVGESFHVRVSEDGSLWDSTKAKNTDNLFGRHFVTPGTLLLQVLTINGRTLPVEALEHLLLCIGMAGAYGGQTSVYGVNVRNHVVGIYASRLPRAIASPYVAAGLLDMLPPTAADAVAALHACYAAEYSVQVPAPTVAATIAGLIKAVEGDDPTLRTRYRVTHQKVGQFFDAWFGFKGAERTTAPRNVAKVRSVTPAAA